MKNISEKMIDGLNGQITAEFESAYLYLSMADYLQARGFPGMARWFRAQANEEKAHALKINDFMISRHVTPDLGEIKAPPKSWRNVIALFDGTYRHECQISDRIYDLVAQGMDDRDFAGLSFLQQYVDEQVEEEAQALGWLEKARRSDASPTGLAMLDEQMGSRRGRG